MLGGAFNKRRHNFCVTASFLAFENLAVALNGTQSRYKTPKIRENKGIKKH